MAAAAILNLLPVAIFNIFPILHHCSQPPYKISNKYLNQRLNYNFLKFKMAVVYHEVFALGYISQLNFMLIWCIVLKIWWFEFFLHNWLEMPINAPKIWVFGVWTPKRDWSSSRPHKTHPWPEPHFLRGDFGGDPLVRPGRDPRNQKRQVKKLSLARFPIDFGQRLI